MSERSEQQGNVKRTLGIVRDERQTGLLPTNLATSNSVFSSSMPSICVNWNEKEGQEDAKKNTETSKEKKGEIDDAW